MDTAAGHTPLRWELVMPLDPSPAEVTWFQTLRDQNRTIELAWRDRAWLDGHFARREYLRRMVEGSKYALLERANEFDKERTVLGGGLPDLAERVRALRERANEIPTGWRIDFAADGSGETFTIAERFPGAAEHDPIRITPVYAFPDDDPNATAAQAQLEKAFAYGLGCTVTQPYLQRIDVDASDETLRLLGLSRTGTASEVRLIPSVDRVGLPMPVIVEAIDPDQAILASVQGTMEGRTHGRRGHRRHRVGRLEHSHADHHGRPARLRRLAGRVQPDHEPGQRQASVRRAPSRRPCSRAHSAVIASTAPATVLPPGYGVSFAVGGNDATFKIVSDDVRGRKYVLTRGIVGFLPAGAAGYEAVASLVDDVDKAAVTARQCLDRGADAFAKAGCGLRFAWDFSVAQAAFLVRAGIALAGRVAGALFNLIETAAWAVNAVSGAREYISAAKDVNVRPANQPPPGQPPSTRRPPAQPPPGPPAGPPIPPPPARTPMTHYDCANENSNIGHYVPPGRYWENGFSAQGSTVTGGWVLVGAHENSADHRVRVGIYSGSGRTGPLAEMIVTARGYDGESFTLPTPVLTTAAQRLWVAVSGVGDFTAYDNRAGCFIARIDGYR